MFIIFKNYHMENYRKCVTTFEMSQNSKAGMRRPESGGRRPSFWAFWRPEAGGLQMKASQGLRPPTLYWPKKSLSARFLYSCSFTTRIKEALNVQASVAWNQSSWLAIWRDPGSNPGGGPCEFGLLFLQRSLWISELTSAEEVNYQMNISTGLQPIFILVYIIYYR